LATENLDLDGPLTLLSGVGPARAARLFRLGVESLRDLLLLVPRRLESSGTAATIAEAREASGEVVVITGSVESRRLNRFGRRSSVRLLVSDGEASIEVVYFNQPWQLERFVVGEHYTFAGRASVSKKGPVLVSPRSAEGAGTLVADRWLPVYALTEGIGLELLRGLLEQAIERSAASLVETLPAEALERLDLPPLHEAVPLLHQPEGPEAFDRARRRVLLEQLLGVQARVLARAASSRSGSACSVETEPRRRAELEGHFPFELTAGQRAILDQLDTDLARSAPMRRLLQGDVGSGKTVLGLYACLSVASAGAQAALMAPTELLAEQHCDGLRPWLEAAGVRAALLTGSIRGAERRARLDALATGELDLVFGTHALFSKDVRYRRLALAVIDEQHRFGVAQRARLIEKGEDVHLLLMTATPIPRTLALTIYGDLEVSLLAEKPPGRGAVQTRWLQAKDRERVPEFLRERLEAGEQVFWVSPRIGEEEQQGAERTFARMRRSELAGFGVELVHGRLATEERAERLARFRRGEARILVATTVIEVGVDVPLATVMVIEDAERLGLAQLHQLRGRIGRSERPSWCLLYGKPVARERFELLERTDDGFVLAEEDLRRRGMGELGGTRQSGELGGVLAEVGADVDLIVAARDLLLGDCELAGRYARAGELRRVTP